MRKIVDRNSEREIEALRKAAAHAEQLRHLPGTGDPDPDRRVEIHDCETSLGRVHVAVERDAIAIHGVSTMLADIDRDLRGALVSTAAAFSAAVTDEEQTDQRTIIGIIIDGVLRRHQWLDAKVRESKQNEQFGV